MTAALTVEEIRKLPAAVDLVTAGRALGVGRTKAHEMARSGEWPTELLRIGTRYRVRRRDLLELLGIDDQPNTPYARAMRTPHKPQELSGAGKPEPTHAITEHGPAVLTRSERPWP